MEEDLPGDKARIMVPERGYFMTVETVPMKELQMAAPVQTLPVLEDLTGVKEGTIRQACYDARVVHYLSGNTLLSNTDAVEYAIRQGRLRRTEDVKV
jgi:hypothetical protein